MFLKWPAKIALASGILLLSATVAFGHHAFAAEFSVRSSVSMTGTVGKVQWLNPHARFYLNVKDARGATTRWEVVLGSPNGLMRQGWTRYTIKEGDSLTVTGYRAKDGSRLASARTVRFSNGKTASLGSSGDGGPDN